MIVVYIAHKNEPVTRAAPLRALVVLAIVLGAVPFLAAPVAGAAGIPAPAMGEVEPAGPLPASVPEGLTAAEWAHLQELVAAAQYQVTWQTRDSVWAYRAPNPAQGADAWHPLGVAFAPDGFTVTGYEVDGVTDATTVAWDLRLTPVAYADARHPGEKTVPPTVSDLSARRTVVTYRWTDSLTEWYENRPDGVKHGLVLHAPPPGAGEGVEITFALRGSLTPHLDGGGQSLRLLDAAGNVTLLYDQLAVTDATGRA